MTEEIKEELKEQKTKICNCDGTCIKVFLLGILASFFGCLLALLLFSATVKPKMPPAPMMFGPPQAQQIHHGKFRQGEYRGQKNKMHSNFNNERFQKKFDKKMSPKMKRPNFEKY